MPTVLDTVKLAQLDTAVVRLYRATLKMPRQIALGVSTDHLK